MATNNYGDVIKNIPSKHYNYMERLSLHPQYSEPNHPMGIGGIIVVLM